MKTSEHSLLEKYNSHFIERVVCERKLETEQNCNILTPTLMATIALLTRAQPGAWGPCHSGTWSSFQFLLSNCNCSVGCWFSLTDLISNWLELHVHRVILLFYVHSVSSHKWPMEYTTSTVFGIAFLIIIERK